jgi:hypothetical protein
VLWAVAHPLKQWVLVVLFQLSFLGARVRLVFAYVFAALVILLAIYHLVLEILRLVYSVKRYFSKFKNYLELALYFSSIVFVFNFATSCGCPQDWQWHLGIFVVFLGWMNLIFYAAKFPRTGIYVLVFTEILVTFLKLVVFGLLLVIAFSLVLFMMFNSPVATVIRPQSTSSNQGTLSVLARGPILKGLNLDRLFCPHSFSASSAE